jgi:hypothetical protein
MAKRNVHPLILVIVLVTFAAELYHHFSNQSADLSGLSMKWPNDVDGDVLRRMSSSGMELSLTYTIDFYVDFDSWPPPPAARDLLSQKYGHIESEEPDDGGDEPHLTFQIVAPVTYELVMRTQADVTRLMQPFGGRCDSWGVWQGSAQD